ncbi:transposase [Bradyrhizobium sp. LMG 9283]|uniref:transposase n=1 Tax=Bradyrhizobium sp. LMG 9283 TaxID=592064 RepID=UPI00388D8BBE
MFRSGREFAAWLGLTPKQNSTDRKDRLGRITKQGDSCLRHLLVIGARSFVRYPKARSRFGDGCIEALLEPSGRQTARCRPPTSGTCGCTRRARSGCGSSGDR